MTNHPASLTDREIIAAAQNIRVDDPSWSGVIVDDGYIKIADAQLRKALEWSADFLKAYRKDLPEWDITRSTLLQGENALRRAIKSSSPE